MRLPWWFDRPSADERRAVYERGGCPRCGSTRVIPIVYGRMTEDGVKSLNARYPDGFYAAGCLVRSFDDPGPDIYCPRCGKRFYQATTKPADVVAGVVHKS
jgi:DNA-directed RNA polymerase subunit RPC12/RpoP